MNILNLFGEIPMNIQILINLDLGGVNLCIINEHKEIVEAYLIVDPKKLGTELIEAAEKIEQIKGNN